MTGNINYNLVDPEIRGLVKYLNAHGYITKASCAGHKGDRYERGHIPFNRLIPEYEYPRLKQILEQFGCKRIQFEIYPDPKGYFHPITGKKLQINDPPQTDVTFTALGEPWKTWKKKRPIEFWKKYYPVPIT